MRKLLLFLMFVLAALTVCALIPWQAPKPAPAPVATITPVVVEQATAMSQPTALPQATETAVPTPTSTAAPLPTVIPSPTFPPLPLSLQPGTPRYLPAFPHADLGCNWAGVAGQVLTVDEAIAPGAVVVVSGMVDGQVVEGMALAGSALGYGPGGYEIDLSAYQSLAGKLAQIRVFDLNGQPLTGVVDFSLPPSCAENLAIITFQMTATADALFLPSVH